jgi:hypothetical protein
MSAAKMRRVLRENRSRRGGLKVAERFPIRFEMGIDAKATSPASSRMDCDAFQRAVLLLPHSNCWRRSTARWSRNVDEHRPGANSEVEQFCGWRVAPISATWKPQVVDESTMRIRSRGELERFFPVTFMSCCLTPNGEGAQNIDCWPGYGFRSKR